MSGTGGPRSVEAVAKAGLVLFLIGFGLFIAVVGTGSYRLDVDTWAEAHVSVAERHQSQLERELQPIFGREFGSVFAFQRETSAAIDRANAQLDGGAQIWDYDRQQYQIQLGKVSGSRFRNLEWIGLLLTVGLGALGALLYFLPRLATSQPGIKNNGTMTSSVKSRGWIGIALGTFLILFYICLYFQPQYLVNWIRLVDPVSRALNGGPASHWFLYGFLYTVTILVMGVRMMIQYRHSRYHLVRTASVMFFQTGFAFLIPEIMIALNKPYYDFKNAWPLDYDFFHGYNMDSYLAGGFGWFILLWGLGLAFLLIPLFAFFFGKRWYCSWVCGCGGLAETLGDPFRHLSDKSTRAWKIERYMVHGVLVFAVVMTGVVLVNYFTGRDGGAPLLASINEPVKQWYGFLIGSIFSGVVGTGFYPFMGNRVWCRFGCPLAAILGMVQRFKSRFRITTNGGQCISCGNCSTYCEMGIDVRAYAQRGDNIVRSSCVGCGVCAAVCPRGVLRLENGPEEGRFDPVDLLKIGRRAG